MEIGAEGRSMHKCQGMGQLLPLPGTFAMRYQLIATTLAGGTRSRPSSRSTDGLDLTVPGLAGFAGAVPAVASDGRRSRAVAGAVTAADRSPAVRADPTAACRTSRMASPRRVSLIRGSTGPADRPERALRDRHAPRARPSGSSSRRSSSRRGSASKRCRMTAWSCPARPSHSRSSLANRGARCHHRIACIGVNSRASPRLASHLCRLGAVAPGADREVRGTDDSPSRCAGQRALLASGGRSGPVHVRCRRAVRTAVPADAVRGRAGPRHWRRRPSA